MKNNQQITAEILIKIAQKLGDNWRYHSISSDKERYRGHYLSNGARLYISVSNAYGADLPQWALSYYHPTHKDTLIKFCQIGCTLNIFIQSLQTLKAVCFLVRAKLTSINRQRVC